MMEFSRWKIWMVIIATIWGVAYSLPNFLPQDVRTSMARYYLPSQTLNLGLDLQGGSYLLLEVDTDALAREKTANLTEDVRARLRQKSIVFSGLSSDANAVNVRITEASQFDAALTELQALATPLQQNPSQKDINVVRGDNQTIRLVFTEEGRRATSAAAVDSSIETVRRRVDSLGTKEPTIVRQGVNRIVVQAPGNLILSSLSALLVRPPS